MSPLKNTALASAIKNATGTSQRLDAMLRAITAESSVEDIKVVGETALRVSARLQRQLRATLLQFMNQDETQSGLEAALSHITQQYAAPGYGPGWFVQFFGLSSLSGMSPMRRLYILSWLAERVSNDGFTVPVLWSQIQNNGGLLPEDEPATESETTDVEEL